MNSKAKILDIAMNLSRIGNWIADGYELKKKRIDTFLIQTDQYIESLDPTAFSNRFHTTLNLFLKEYKKMKLNPQHTKDEELLWAEKMLTWGNILTHRAKLI